MICSCVEIYKELKYIKTIAYKLGVRGQMELKYSKVLVLSKKRLKVPILKNKMKVPLNNIL